MFWQYVLRSIVFLTSKKRTFKCLDSCRGISQHGVCGIISLAGIPKQLTFGEAQLIVNREILLEKEHRIANEAVGSDDIRCGSVVVVDRF